MDNDIIIFAKAAIFFESNDIDKFEEAIQKDGGEEKHLTKILNEISSKCKLWHDAELKAYATFENGKHTENWPIDSKIFKEWIGYVVYKTPQLKIGALGKTQLEEVCSCLSAHAKFDGMEFPIAKRVAKVGQTYFIDICNPDWQCIEVSSKGWKILDKPPTKAVDKGHSSGRVPLFKFIRSANARPLPLPIVDGSLKHLFELTNIPESDHLLVLAWMLECFRPDTPYPVLEITGEQGSAKSTTQEVLRCFIDPNRVMLRARPKSVEDVYVAAVNSHLISFENLSGLSPEMSDALCVIATGGGFAARTLYTNTEETVLSAHAPIILNGINQIATRPDLIDRVISIDLPVITQRIDENEHQKKLEELSPSIFGGILDLFSKTLEILPSIDIDPEKLPRMADFTKLGEAMSQTMGNHPGTFLNLYIERRKESVLNILDSSPVAKAITGFVNSEKSHVGTVADLLGRLNSEVRGFFEEDTLWPKSARGLANEMRRLAPALRQLGIVCEVTKRKRDGVWCEVKKCK